MGRPRRPVAERFWSKVRFASREECWFWEGALRAGYGVFNVNRERRYEGAHRFAYEQMRGKTIPERRQIDHLCRNSVCVNPWHLEVVSPRENQMRGLNGRLKTHCPYGHAYKGENLGLLKDGRRYCRACNRLRQRAFNSRVRQKLIKEVQHG